MADKITWHEVKTHLGDLQPWGHNPRKSSKKQAAKILESWGEFNQVHTFAIGPGGEVYDGHQRLSALMTLHGNDYVVDARQSSRALSEDEHKRLVVLLHAGAVGSWDWDLLSGWDIEDLKAAGMDMDTLADWEKNLAALDKMLHNDNEDETYTREIKSPAYQITGEKPNASDLYDNTRTLELIEAIQEADGITDEERAFLIVAAQRHTVLNFHNIAEYYAHADKQLQDLMEDSALVIIDFGKAIELGYVQLTEEIAEIVQDEYGDV